MEEAVFIDGVRTPNGRAHREKGWFRKLRPDELLTVIYQAIFERNKKVKPEDVDALLVGCANISGVQNDIGRLAWLASGLPDSVPSNTMTNQCPSGMSATMHAARAIMTGQTDIMLAAGVEDMEKVPMGANFDFPPRLLKYYNGADLPMGPTAEKVAEQWNVSREDMDNMAVWSNKKAAAARDEQANTKTKYPGHGSGRRRQGISGGPRSVDPDKVDPAKMATMTSPYKPDGRCTAARRRR